MIVQRDLRFAPSAPRKAVETVSTVISVIAAGMMVSGCQESAEVRYRVTVNALSDGMVRSGSSVWSFTLTRGMYGSYDARLRGEAVVVDLGSRGRLFGLLAGRTKAGLPSSYDDMGLLPEALFGDIARGRSGQPPLHANRIDDLRAIRQHAGAVHSLPCSRPRLYADQCLSMVRFAEPADVTSVQPVDPNDLARSFGEGVSLKDVTVEITDDPVTKSTVGTLPDYRNTPEFARWYARLAVDDLRRIGPENFSRGDKP